MGYYTKSESAIQKRARPFFPNQETDKMDFTKPHIKKPYKLCAIATPCTKVIYKSFIHFWTQKMSAKCLANQFLSFLLFLFLKISYSFKTKSGKNQENVKHFWQRLVLIYQAFLWSKKGGGGQKCPNTQFTTSQVFIRGHP